MKLALAFVLNDRQSTWRDIRNNTDLRPKIVSMLLTSIVCLALYGLIIGASHSATQALSSAVKLPLLYLLTMSVCFPTLFVFSALLGARKAATQHFAVLLCAITAIALIQLAFAPITLLFMVTSKAYTFFKILNVVLFTVSGLIGVRFFFAGMGELLREDIADAKLVRKILRTWGVLFAVVGTQLGWTLRPFFGSPDEPFQWLRQISGNFYVDLAQTLMNAW